MISESEPLSSEQTRTELRRLQVINAASSCFRRHGFHGASMAEISRCAGMSVGHIYHYFANKEALIAAIVEYDTQRAFDFAARLQTASASGQLHGAVVALTEEILSQRLDPEHAALKLEVLAEAARNPKVAEIVQAAEGATRRRFREVVELNRRTLGVAPDPDQEARMDVLAALFGGLTMRVVENPRLDRAAMIPLIEATVGYILSQGCAAAPACTGQARQSS